MEQASEDRQEFLREVTDADGMLNEAAIRARQARLQSERYLTGDQLVILGRRDDWRRICAKKQLTADQVVEWVNKLDPAGKWVIDKSVDPIACKDDRDRQHWILTC